MTDFKLHTKDSAPEGAKDLLEQSEESVGFIPNLHAVMAEAPALLKAYQTMEQIFGETSFSAEERNVIWLTVSYENECHYCMAAHTAIAKMAKLDDEHIEALRNGESLSDDKLEALRRFTATLVNERGWADEDEIQEFLEAGYGRQQVLEVVVGVAMKLLSNYTNHLADTPIDDSFADFEWPGQSEAAE